MTIDTISTLPTAPSRDDAPATFISRANAFLAALVTMQGELNTSIGQMNTDIGSTNTNVTLASEWAIKNDAAVSGSDWSAFANASGASPTGSAKAWATTAEDTIVADGEYSGKHYSAKSSASATAAASSATAAANTANAALWVSGQSYAAGDNAISGVNYKTYRANTSTSGTTDPSASGDWVALAYTLPDQSGNSGKFLTTNGTVESWADVTTDPTIGTLTKTFLSNEQATISLTSSVLAPVVTVTKEVSQTGSTNNTWDVNSTDENYTRLDSAPATTLDFVGFDVSNASYSQSFSTSGQDTHAQDIRFNADGTKMFVLGSGSDYVNEYALTTGFDVSTASYTQQFSVASQETNPKGLAFNTDGTKMYVCGNANNTVYEYTLSTGFDVSTASYSQSFSVASQGTGASGINWNNDGTKMFIVDAVDQEVNEYNLTTGFDVSTASFSQNFSVSTQEATPTGIAWNGDGTKMFIVGEAGQDVNEYNLTTGFDVSTASYSQNFSVSGQETVVTGVDFNTDGSKMFIVGEVGDAVFEYSVSFVFQLGTGSFASADVGKTIEANDGVFILASTAGAFTEVTAPTSYSQVASGSWDMYAVIYNTIDGDLELSKYSLGYVLSAASYDSKSFNFLSEDNNASACGFNADGTKLYVLGDQNNSLFQYSMTTPFDVSTASYDSKSLSVSSQETSPQGFCFNNDGTKLYVVGYGNDTVYQYSLTTAYDVSTGSYDSVSKSIAAEETIPRVVRMSSDGTKMYIMGDSGRDVNQYTMSTAFDVSTASFDSVTFSLLSQDTAPLSIDFSADGTKMFMCGNTNDSIFQYSLTTAWDVSTASYDSISFSTASQTTAPKEITFSADGTKMYTMDGAGTRTVYQYSTETATAPSGYHAVHTTNSTDSTYWTDINSMTADEAAGDGSIFYCVSTDDRSTWKIAKASDGERSIVKNNSGTWQYNSNGTYGSETWTNATTNTELNALQEAMEGASYTIGFDISTSSFVDSFSVSAQDGGPRDVAFNTDGTKMFVVGSLGDEVNEYDLSTGFDVSTATFSQVFSVTAQDTNPNGLAFNADGTKMFVAGATGQDINEYDLTTGFDVSTATYSQNFSVNGQDTSPQGLAFNTDGTKMFVVGAAGEDVNEYTLSTGFDISTASFVDSFSVSAQENVPQGLAFNTDGTKMYVVGQTGQDVNEYTLSTGFDVSTASYSQSFSISTQDIYPYGIAFNNDGTKMFITGGQGIDVNEYTTGSTVYTNQMNKTQLDAVSDANHFTLANDLDLGIIFNMTSGSLVPSSDGVSINYDANVLNQGAILGTDYNFDAPAQDKARITSLISANLKVRVV